MDFLACKGIIHGDLAAKNVLITSDMTIKLADFGLSHRVYTQPKNPLDMRKSRQGPFTDQVPVKYSAIEVLRADRAILELSDIWSFGIYMWEIFHLCLATPYYGVAGGKLL